VWGGGALSALHFADKQAPQHKLQVQGLILDSFLADWDARTLHSWLDVCEHYYVRNEKALQEQHEYRLPKSANDQSCNPDRLLIH
jgi:hypothetical protein